MSFESVMAFVLLHAVHYAGATTIGTGAAVGFFNWLGFIGVVGCSGFAMWRVWRDRHHYGV